MAAAVNNISISILIEAQKSYNRACRLFWELKVLGSSSKDERRARKYDIWERELLGVVNDEFIHITHYNKRIISLVVNNQSIFSIDCEEGKFYGFELGGLEYRFDSPILHNVDIYDFDFFLDLIGQAITQG